MRGKHKAYQLFLILLTGIILNFSLGFKVLATPSEAERTTLILIDPGHGGRDSGAISRKGAFEKDINLGISLKIREKLRSLGYEVVLTREEDKDFYGSGTDVYWMKRLDLNTRCQIKRDSNCDLFMSIHQNFFPDSSCKGAQVWYSRNEESKRFSKLLQQNFKQELNFKNREEKEAKNDYKILRCFTNIPSVIVECGFLTNPDEATKLVTEEYQEKIANIIVKSIKQYYNNQDSLTLE